VTHGLVILTVPLLILPGLSFYFDVTPKLAVLLGGASLALLLAEAAPMPLSRTARWFRLLLAAQALSLLLSTAVSTNRALSITGTNWRRFGLVAQLSLLAFVWLVSRSLARDPAAGVLRILRLVAAAGVAAALYGILQYFGWDPWLPSRAYHIGEGEWTIVRPPGTLGHASYLADFLLHAVFAGSVLLLAESKKRWRFLGAAIVALGSTAILLSGARAALLGLLAGALLLLVWFRARLRLVALMPWTLLLAGLVSFYFTPSGQKLRARVRWSLEDPRGGARLLLWRDSLRMPARHWAAGFGPEMFPVQFPRLQSAELSRSYPDFYHESPHNVFLDALAAQGVPGVAILAALATLGFIAARRGRTSQPVLTGALAAMLAAALVSQQFAAFVLPTALCFYLTIAMLAALPPPEDHTRAEVRPAARLFAAAGRIAATGVFLLFAVCLVVSDGALALTKAHIEAGRLDEAIAAHRRSLKWRPPGMNAELWYSRSLMLLAGRSPYLPVRLRAAQLALETGVLATRSSEEPQNAWYSLAALYAARNALAGTERCLRAAIDASPNWFKPHWTLAQVLAASGRLEEAEREAALAVSLNGGKNPEVVRTLAEVRARLHP